MTDLERLLAEVGPSYPFPPTPAVASAVASRLPERRRPRRLLAAAALGLVVAVALVLAVSSRARGAVLDWLDAVPGVRIHHVHELPPSALIPGAELDFGRRISLAEARRRFELSLPPDLGHPNAVYLDRDAGGAAITLRFGRRAVLTEWQTTAVLFSKLVLGGTRVEHVRVGDDRGVWIAGGDHAVYYLGLDDAREHVRDGALAGNVLLWQHGLVGYRLEVAAGRARAIELAESTRP